MGVFVIPNEKIGNVDLTRFQVSLEKLEAYTGNTFHSKLDRSKVGYIVILKITTSFCKSAGYMMISILVIFYVHVQVLDLCTADTCKLMSVEKMVLYSYTKKWVHCTNVTMSGCMQLFFCRLNSARSGQELDRLWEELQSKNIKPDDVLKKIYRRKKEEFDSTV